MKLLVSFLISILLCWQIIADDSSHTTDSSAANGSSAIPAGAGGFGNSSVTLPTNVSIGHSTEIPIEDYPEVLVHLNASLPRLSTGYSSPMQLVNVTKITKQVVSGIMYDIHGTFNVGNLTLNCEVWVWYKGWMKDIAEKYRVKGSCQDQSQTWRPANDTETW